MALPEAWLLVMLLHVEKNVTDLLALAATQSVFAGCDPGHDCAKAEVLVIEHSAKAQNQTKLHKVNVLFCLVCFLIAEINIALMMHYFAFSSLRSLSSSS